MDDIRIGRTRIDLVLIIDGDRMDYVLVETERDGNSATVVAGPKDAGGDMVYRLRKEAAGWKVVGTEVVEEP